MRQRRKPVAPSLYVSAKPAQIRPWRLSLTALFESVGFNGSPVLRQDDPVLPVDDPGRPDPSAAGPGTARLALVQA